MIENREFCNLTGRFRLIGFKTGLFNCREAAYLNKYIETGFNSQLRGKLEPLILVL